MEMKSGTAALETVWQFLTKQNIVLLYDLAIVLLAIYPNELKISAHTKTCLQMFIADPKLEAIKMTSLQ